MDAVSFSRLIHAEIARNGINPGREFRAGLIAIGGFDNLQKDLLQDLFGEFCAPATAQNIIEKCALVAPYELLECGEVAAGIGEHQLLVAALLGRDRKSTRLNSSHVRISYAVFCLK